MNNLTSRLRRPSSLGFGALLLPLLLSCTPREEGASPVAAALKAQADRWDQAILRKDVQAIADNMTGDFRHIGKGGETTDRATFLRELTASDLVIHPYTVEDLDIRVYGDCALLCGRTRMTGSYQGKPFTSHYRYIDTYIRVDGKWKVCNVQITAMPG